MKTPLNFLLALLLLLAYAQGADGQAAGIRGPGKLQEGNLDSVMPALAREAIAAYRDEDRERYLGLLSRPQLVAGPTAGWAQAHHRLIR